MFKILSNPGTFWKDFETSNHEISVPLPITDPRGAHNNFNKDTCVSIHLVARVKPELAARLLNICTVIELRNLKIWFFL